MLQEANLDNNAFVITEQDIISYDWDHQILKLDQKLRLRYEASAADFLRDFSPFVVTFDGERLFGGMIIQPFSPLALKYPVLYVLNGPQYEPTEELSIALRSTHNHPVKFDTIALFPGNDATAKRLRERLMKLGKLKG